MSKNTPTLRATWEKVGGLSKPSKMPGYGYSISAKKCHVGSRLRKIENSVCSTCYALKGRYVFDNVKKAHANRFRAMKRKDWKPNMIRLINHYCQKEPYFRWHDAGDLQSIDHLKDIVDICRETPTVNHWLPTREYQMVKEYLATYKDVPSNLVIRLSAHMIEGSQAPTIPGTVKSEVYRATPKGHSCPARTQDNECGPCRACWNPAVQIVSYPVH